MTAAITASQGETVVAFLDPVITYDTALFDAEGIQLAVSSGVGNATSPVPLPATFPLFASSLSIVGLYARRRTQHYQTAVIA